MVKMFTSPSCYIQGKDAFKNQLCSVARLGGRPLLITDEIIWELIGKQLVEDLKECEITETKTAIFNGETTEEEINKMIEQAEDADFVIALGGGKAIDTGKAAAFQLDLPIAVLPTAASMDGPTSRISVLYDENGLFRKYAYYPKNPDLVLVDTQVIANGPVSLLISGIGDAMSTYVEARSVWKNNGNNTLGTRPTVTAIAIAEKCRDILFERTVQALAANEAHVVTEALEEVVEANLLLSGLGFESGGLSLAHALHNAFAVNDGKINRLSHGQKVAFATLVQLMIENAEIEELDRYIQFYQFLGVPTTLEEMHLDQLSYEELVQIGEQATIKNESAKEFGWELAPEEIAAGMMALDQYVKNRRS